MEQKSRESLIYGLYKEFNSTSNDAKADSTFNMDTNTLYSNRNETSSNGRARHEIALEDKEYDVILRGQVHHYVCKDKQYKWGDELAIKEHSNFVLTGRTLIKEISYIQRHDTCPALEEGYCILSWK